MVTGIAKGTASVVASVELADKLVADTVTIVVADETVEPPVSTRSGTIVTTSSYLLEGSFEISETADGIQIDIASDYKASTALPGLYVYLGNNPSSIANAFEIQAVQVFEGEHSYEIPDVGLNDYNYILYWCKPFGVKVDEGEIN